jgi:hypothetical protein
MQMIWVAKSLAPNGIADPEKDDGQRQQRDEDSHAHV